MRRKSSSSCRYQRVATAEERKRAIGRHAGGHLGCRAGTQGGAVGGWALQGFFASVSSAVLEWLPACRASGIPLFASCLVRSALGSVDLESTAVPDDGALSAVLLEGSVFAAPWGVPGVVVEDEDDGAAEEGAAEGAAEPGAAEAGPAAGVVEAGADDPGAVEAGAAGADSGASARLQPASMTPAASKAASIGAVKREGKCFMFVFMVSTF